MSEESGKVCLFKRAKKPQRGRGQRRRHESSDSNKSSASSDAGGGSGGSDKEESSVVVRTERSKRGGLTQSSAGFKTKKKFRPPGCQLVAEQLAGDAGISFFGDNDKSKYVDG